MAAAALSSRVKPTSRVAFRSARRTPVTRRPVQIHAFKVTLKTPSGDSVIECDKETFILDAAEDAQIDLPFSCRSGTCSSCAGMILSGTVDQSDQNFLDKEQMEKGFVMTCIAYPTSDVVIQTHQEEALY